MDEDDDLEVVLVDGPGAASTRTIELRPRRRGRELLLVGVAVAVVGGIGLLGDGGEDGIAAAPTTTSTRRSVSTSGPERERTTSTRRSTTTTTWPQFHAGTGPLLPGGPTSTHIGMISGSGTVTIVDLDTGDRCETLPSRQGAWGSWGHQAPTGHLLVQTGAGIIAVDRDCAMAPLSVDVADEYVAAAAGDRVWLTSHDGARLHEIALPGGNETGRTVDVPPFNMGMVLAAGDNLVIAAAGDMTLIDPDTGARRSLGAGQPLATQGDVLAFATCPEARCRLGIMDVRTGTRRLLGDVQPVLWSSSAFSPDGRFLLVPVAGARREVPVGAILDTRTGSARELDAPVDQGVFTADSRWLIAVTGDRLQAHRVDEREPGIWLEGVNGAQSLVRL